MNFGFYKRWGIFGPSSCQLVERERKRDVPFEVEAMFDFEQLVGSFLSIDKVKTFPQSAAWLLRVTHPHKVATSP